MDKLNKIIVIGSPGSGKTYFSNRLSNLNNIPVYHLDDLYWNENWKKTESDEWIRIQEKILDLDSFIVDGNYLDSLEIRMKKSDLIIFIDRGLMKCLFGFFKRTLKNKFGTEINLPEKIKKQKKHKVTEKGMFKFALYIVKFHLFKKSELKNLLCRYSKSKKIVVLKNRIEINNYYRECSYGEEC